MAGVRLTTTTKMVLKTLLDHGGELSGSQIRDKAHSWVLFSGTIYPILSRLERAGWLESRWEEIDPKEEKRPRKRFYRVTENGERLAKEAIRA